MFWWDFHSLTITWCPIYKVPAQHLWIAQTCSCLYLVGRYSRPHGLCHLPSCRQLPKWPYGLVRSRINSLICPCYLNNSQRLFTYQPHSTSITSTGDVRANLVIIGRLSHSYYRTSSSRRTVQYVLFDWETAVAVRSRTLNIEMNYCTSYMTNHEDVWDLWNSTYNHCMRAANDAAGRSKTVSSLGISADSPPINYHSCKVRVDNWKMCIHYIVYT
jgi:hypothetical protein